MSPQILIFVLFLISLAYTSEKIKPSQSISTIKTSSLENDTMSSSTENFLQMPNSIWTSVVTKYLNIIDIFHFYCINRKNYYGIYEKEFQANIQEWFKKNTETLQILLGKQERVQFYFPSFPQCEFIVNFPSAKIIPDTFADEAWECTFTIDVAVKPSTTPRLILE